MARGTMLKNPLRENHLFRQRSIVAAVGVAFLLLLLLLRLVYLQVFRHEHFATLSTNNSVNVVPVAPTRGLIYDRNGVLLAENIPTFSVELIPEAVPDIEQTLRDIAALINVSDSDLSRFREELKRRRRFEEIPLRFRLNDEEVALLAVNRYRLPGVEVNSRLTRYYPLGTLTAHSVGYVGRISEEELKTLDEAKYSATSHIGKVGVEKAYEEQLHGQVGYQQVETNARGRVLRIIDNTPPTPGQNLYLNIDIRLQRVAEEAFAGEWGALVAVDPNNGAVLALVSLPSFDPNLFVNGIDAKTYNELINSAERPLYNRALRGQYPPGSTLKPFVGLAGLENGVISTSEPTYCPGYFMLKGDDHRYRDWKKDGHGAVNITNAIVQSCDVYFYSLAQQLGIDRLSSFLGQFGFGSPTGIDIGGEAGGILPSKEWKRKARKQAWFPGETLITGIGQGYNLTTPAQLAAATAALASHGKHMAPMVVHATQDPASGTQSELALQPFTEIPVKNPANWNTVVSAMTQVVHGAGGTARGISRDITYQIAGKTGTAQVFGIKQDARYVESEVQKRLRDHALFVAFAPVDDPKIAVGIIVENGGHGGSVAAPIVRRLMDTYLLPEAAPEEPAP
ncbi:MAG TPA: penicillin-binding protein 2 [Gammaproteobacteria bacterium]